MSRQFKTGEWVLLANNFTNSKNEIIAEAGTEARIMVYDPSKEETPYGLRTPTGSITQGYVGESMLVKYPARANETPVGV